MDDNKLTATDMHRISRVKVLVVGADPLGYETVSNMAELGFRRFVICDPLFVSPSDLTGGYNDSDLGRFRATVVRSKVLRDFPGVSISTCLHNVDEMDGWNYDLYISCNESPSTRLCINSHAKQYRVPFIDGVLEGTEGRIQSVIDSGPCLECGTVPIGFSMSEGRRPVCTDYRSVLELSKYLSVEAVKVVCGHTDSVVKGVMYYDGIDGTVRHLRMGISRKCPNHLGEPCQSILKSSMYQTMRLL